MKDYPLDGNKEMVAMGTMNVIGSLTSCYVATGTTEEVIKNSSIYVCHVIFFHKFDVLIFV